MSLYSLLFILFLIVTLLIYYSLNDNRRWICLLVSSILFYFSFGITFILYMIFTAVSIFLAGCVISRYQDEWAGKKKELSRDEKKALKAKLELKKKAVLFLAIILNFGLLAFLKMPISGKLGLVMPLGISFYMFQTVGYLVDVYYDKCKAEKNFPHFFLFVSYFPALIQGPINRYDQMRKQFFAGEGQDANNVTKTKIDVYRMKNALMRGLYGVMKKYVIANSLSPFVSAILDKTGNDTPGSLIIAGILMYSAQQYADFSGGIDMVMAVSSLFGIDMMENFKRPYFSTSLGDFWRRWHISLGSFMRDYVFYPFALTKPMAGLGKFAKEKLGKHFGRVLPASIANILVFFLVGIWHGYEMHFVLWGLYNGIIIALSDICFPLFEKLTDALKIKKESKGFHIFCIVRTFIIVNIGWYFDRIYDVRKCMEAFKNTVVNFGAGRLLTEMNRLFTDLPRKSLLIAFLGIIIVFIVSVMQEKGIDVYKSYSEKSFGLRLVMLYALIILIMISFTFAVSAGGFMYAAY